MTKAFHGVIVRVRQTNRHKMRNIPFLVTLTAVIFSSTVASLAEYNPATGEDDFVIIGTAQEVRMGKSLARKVEEKFGLTKDVGMQMRVDELGKRIAEVCDRSDLTYSFGVIEGKELKKEQRYNAFALPGGYVYIFKDMVEDMESDDELASILAHEVGHIVARHSVKRLQGTIGITALSLVGAVTKADKRERVETSIAIGQLMMSYSRQAEFEADKLGAIYMKRAGFDPMAAVRCMDRMLERQLNGKIGSYRYFRTHPYTSERRAALKKEIEGKIAFDDYINTIEPEQLLW